MAGIEIRRGDVYLIDLAGFGGRLEKKRPVVVVQNDIGNRYSPETIVAAIRDAHGGRTLPVHVPLGKGIAGLAKDSLLDAGHISTVPKEALTHLVGRVPLPLMQGVDRALRTSLHL